MKLYAKIQKIFDMTKLWLGKVGALLRIIQKETVSVTFDTASVAFTTCQPSVGTAFSLPNSTV